MAEQLTFMAVHAHPDDEVFGTGGTLARLSSEGVRTVLVTCTRGEVGEIVDPELDEAAKADIFKRLGEVREVELQNAVAALGINELRFLDYRDSGMAGTDDNQNPASFYRANFDEAVKRLVKYIREFKPQVMVTYNPWGGYGHPDHVQAHRVTAIAFDAAGDARFYPDLGLEPWQPSKLYYAVIPRSGFQKMAQLMRERGLDGPWNNPEMEMDEWGDPDNKVTTQFYVYPFGSNKKAALAAHKTQIEPTNFFFQLPDDMQESIMGNEYFSLVRNESSYRLPEGQLEDDVMAGFR